MAGDGRRRVDRHAIEGTQWRRAALERTEGLVRKLMDPRVSSPEMVGRMQEDLHSLVEQIAGLRMVRCLTCGEEIVERDTNGIWTCAGKQVVEGPAPKCPDCGSELQRASSWAWVCEKAASVTGPHQWQR